MRFDANALRRGHEQHDASLIVGLYAGDPESTTVDAGNPPSRPRTLRGKEEVAAYWQHVMSRGMTHEVERVVDGGDRVAFQVACRYDNGTRVLASHMRSWKAGRSLARRSCRRGIAEPRARSAHGRFDQQR